MNQSTFAPTTAAASPVYMTVNEILLLVGSTWSYDYMWVYLVTLMSAVGFVLNMLSFVVYQQAKFNTSLYDYLRVYSINSAQICFLSIFVFVANAPHVLPACAHSYWPQAYFIYLYIPFFNTGYFYGTALDVLITLDRIFSLTPRLQSYANLVSPYKLSFAFGIVCLAINFPFFFVFTPSSMTLPISPTENYTIWFIGETEFAISHVGTIVSFTVYAIKDGLFPATEVVANVISIMLLRSHLNKKTVLLKRSITSRVGTAIQTITVGPATDQRSVSKTESTRTANNYGAAAGAFRQNMQQQQPIVSFANANMSKISAGKASRLMEQKMSIMVVLMCVLTCFEHVLLITSCIYPILAANAIVFHNIYFYGVLVIVFKHTMNFVLFFLFNSIFRKACFNMIKL
jgi:hypothetical protein